MHAPSLQHTRSCNIHALTSSTGVRIRFESPWCACLAGIWLGMKTVKYFECRYERYDWQGLSQLPSLQQKVRAGRTPPFVPPCCSPCTRAPCCSASYMLCLWCTSAYSLSVDGFAPQSVLVFLQHEGAWQVCSIPRATAALDTTPFGTCAGYHVPQLPRYQFPLLST